MSLEFAKPKMQKQLKMGGTVPCPGGDPSRLALVPHRPSSLWLPGGGGGTAQEKEGTPYKPLQTDLSPCWLGRHPLERLSRTHVMRGPQSPVAIGISWSRGFCLTFPPAPGQLVHNTGAFSQILDQIEREDFCWGERERLMFSFFEERSWSCF